MARNRKNSSVALRFGPAIKALLTCALFVAAGVGYVWQKSLIADLNQQIKTREQVLEKCQYENKKLCEQLAGLRSSKQLNDRLRELNLGLELPQEAQVWRLAEPAGPLPVRPPPAVQQFAARP